MEECLEEDKELEIHNEKLHLLKKLIHIPLSIYNIPYYPQRQPRFSQSNFKLNLILDQQEEQQQKQKERTNKT